LNITTVQKFIETCPDRKTVFFCGRVDQATNLVTLLRVAGIKAKLVVGNTSMQERDVIFTELKNGDIQAIASVGALTEGFDEKSVNCVVLNRPIKSKALLKQAIGRGLRKFAGLPDCIILDMGDSIKRVLQGDPLAKIMIDLCPKHRRTPIFAKDFQVNEFKFPLKQCPKCGHEHIAILRVCPDCGHIYTSHELPVLKLGDNWGEVPDPLTLTRINYIRSQLRTAFTRETNPNKVRFNFYQKFKKFPADSWFFGALFGGKNPGTNLIRYREHLNKVLRTPMFTPRERDIEIWVKREFHKDQSHSLYLPPDKSSDPFIILGVGTSIIESGKISELEQSYRAKASQIEQEYHAGLYSQELYLTYCQCIDTAYQTIRANFEIQENQNEFML
jgi:ribosomal protein L32